MITFGSDLLHDFDQAVRKEWLETNGLGGYASSTVVCANTRRHHGLLVVTEGDVLDRYVMLSKLEESVRIGEATFELGVNKHPGIVHPCGHLLLEQFELAPLPTFRYSVGSCLLEKTIFMVHGRNVVIAQYRLEGEGGEVELFLRPMVAGRRQHELVHENAQIRQEWRITAEGIEFDPYNAVPTLYFSHDSDNVMSVPLWYNHFEYEQEMTGESDYREDLFQPGVLMYKMTSGVSRTFIASTSGYVSLHDVGSLEESEIQRRQTLVVRARSDTLLEQALMLAADSFFYLRPDGTRSVVAGYPGFGDWVRDALVALPGLALATGEYQCAREVLLNCATRVAQALELGQPVDSELMPGVRDVDSPLWLFVVAYQYVRYTLDLPFVRDSLYETFLLVVRTYSEGRCSGIGMDRDGLLELRSDGVPLTWMNATTGGVPVTPRDGKPVEVEALWYNALKIISEFARSFGERSVSDEFTVMATVARSSFNASFWNEEQQCLYDRVDRKKTDATVRPNQVLAVSLPFALLNENRSRLVLRKIEQELLTPFGVRTLSENSSLYRGRCEGSDDERGTSYHQGSVWPWLLGHFISAYLRFNGSETSVRSGTWSLVERLEEHLLDAGLGTISELFDGDDPHSPRGSISHAWSVGEILRAYREDILGIKPRGKKA